MSDQPAQDTIPRCARCRRPTSAAGRHLETGLVACPPLTRDETLAAARARAEEAGELWIIMPKPRGRHAGTTTAFGPYTEQEYRDWVDTYAVTAPNPPKVLRIVEDYDISGDAVRAALQVRE